MRWLLYHVPVWKYSIEKNLFSFGNCTLIKSPSILDLLMLLHLACLVSWIFRRKLGFSCKDELQVEVYIYSGYRSWKQFNIVLIDQWCKQYSEHSTYTRISLLEQSINSFGDLLSYWLCLVVVIRLKSESVNYNCLKRRFTPRSTGSI